MEGHGGRPALGSQPGKFSLLISARMGVGHAGVAVKKEVVLEADARFGRPIDDGQIFAKKSSSRVSVAGSRLVYYY